MKDLQTKCADRERQKNKMRALVKRRFGTRRRDSLVKNCALCGSPAQRRERASKRRAERKVGERERAECCQRARAESAAV